MSSSAYADPAADSRAPVKRRAAGKVRAALAAHAAHVDALRAAVQELLQAVDGAAPDAPPERIL